jgi:hypothetical protein
MVNQDSSRMLLNMVNQDSSRMLLNMVNQDSSRMLLNMVNQDSSRTLLNMVNQDSSRTLLNMVNQDSSRTFNHRSTSMLSSNFCCTPSAPCRMASLSTCPQFHPVELFDKDQNKTHNNQNKLTPLISSGITCIAAVPLSGFTLHRTSVIIITQSQPQISPHACQGRGCS